MEAKTYFDPEKKLWKGENTLPFYNPEASLGQVLLNTFTVFGPKVAQVRAKIVKMLKTHKLTEIYSSADKL